MKRLILITLLLFSFVSCKQEEKGYIFEVLYGGGYKDTLSNFEDVKLVTESIDLKFTLARLELEAIDAFVTNNYTAEYLSKNNNLLLLTDKKLQKNLVGIGFNKEDKNLYKAIDNTLKNIIQDGTLEEINENYLVKLFDEKINKENKKKYNLDKNKLIVAFPNGYPPFSYMEEGELKGFDVEIAKEIASRLDLEFEGILTDRVGMENRLIQGRYDMIMGNIAIDTKKDLLYSEPYYESIGMVITRKGSKLEI